MQVLGGVGSAEKKNGARQRNHNSNTRRVCVCARLALWESRKSGEVEGVVLGRARVRSSSVLRALGGPAKLVCLRLGRGTWVRRGRRVIGLCRPLVRQEACVSICACASGARRLHAPNTRGGGTFASKDGQEA